MMLMLAVGLAVVFYACKNDEQGVTQGEAAISGTVTNAATGAPISGVTVQAQSVSAATQNTATDGQGQYRFTFATDSAKIITLTFVKSGYRDSTASVQITPGSVTPVNVRLAARSPISVGGGGGSGLAQTIAFLGANPREVTVYGVGGDETAILGFEVRDSLGLPIDAAHSVGLSFSITNGPNGGEYLSPLTVQTNQAGQAYTTFNSGIRSGVVQVLATTTVGGRTLSSSPIRLVIHAGYPDQAHFTVGPERHNFPTLGLFGLRDAISVLIGDIYSNPVAPNTAVYFRSSAGVIQASVFTSADGEGHADLISGNPAPFGIYAAPPPLDTAYHYVVARTVGQGGVTVRDSTLILWSGRSQVSPVSPDTFTIANGNFRSFAFRVSDAYGHPLAAGTSITVTASVPPPPDPNAPVNQVQLAFGVQGVVVLEDVITRGSGATDFSFLLSDGTITVNQATSVTVSISVTGPNGVAYRTISGIVY
ncbi:MAG: hypothetical protein HW412_50 [Bacteroidetes bacterium]|nr:hypothetical protein [Bacteroidota bacterium]